MAVNFTEMHFYLWSFRMTTMRLEVKCTPLFGRKAYNRAYRLKKGVKKSYHL